VGALLVGTGAWWVSASLERGYADMGYAYLTASVGLAPFALGMTLAIASAVELLEPRWAAAIHGAARRHLASPGAGLASAVALGAIGTALLGATADVGGFMVYHPFAWLSLPILGCALLLFVQGAVGMLRHRTEHLGGVVTVVLLSIFVGLPLAGQLLADQQADVASAGVGQAERASLIGAARIFWDNPFQRVAFRAYAVTRIPDVDAGPDQCGGGTEGPMFLVTAYTLFGVRLDSISCRAPPVSVPSGPPPAPVGPH